MTTAAFLVLAGDPVNLLRSAPNSDCPFSVVCGSKPAIICLQDRTATAAEDRLLAKKPIVVSETEARQAIKPGVVRYILAASLILVVVLFAIAYVFFH